MVIGLNTAQVTKKCRERRPYFLTFSGSNFAASLVLVMPRIKCTKHLMGRKPRAPSPVSTALEIEYPIH